MQHTSKDDQQIGPTIKITGCGGDPPQTHSVNSSTFQNNSNEITLKYQFYSNLY